MAKRTIVSCGRGRYVTVLCISWELVVAGRFVCLVAGAVRNGPPCLVGTGRRRAVPPTTVAGFRTIHPVARSRRTAGVRPRPMRATAPHCRDDDAQRATSVPHDYHLPRDARPSSVPQPYRSVFRHDAPVPGELSPYRTVDALAEPEPDPHHRDAPREWTLPPSPRGGLVTSRLGGPGARTGGHGGGFGDGNSGGSCGY